MPTQTPSPGSRTPDPATATPDTAPTPRLNPETCSAKQEEQAAILTGPFLPSMADLKATELDAMVRQYVTTMLWASVGDGNHPLDDSHGPDDVAEGTKAGAREACIGFLRGAVAAGVTLDALRQLERSHHLDFENLGHDLWLTRNRHGAGFWDRGLGKLGDTLTEVAHAMGSRDAYVGDDGLVYVQ